MEPPEISRNLLFGNLQQLVFITGLDVNSNIQHASLVGIFVLFDVIRVLI
jgi:hypothetical protein